MKDHLSQKKEQKKNRITIYFVYSVKMLFLFPTDMALPLY